MHFHQEWGSQHSKNCYQQPQMADFNVDLTWIWADPHWIFLDSNICAWLAFKSIRFHRNIVIIKYCLSFGCCIMSYYVYCSFPPFLFLHLISHLIIISESPTWHIISEIKDMLWKTHFSIVSVQQQLSNKWFVDLWSRHSLYKQHRTTGQFIAAAESKKITCFCEINTILSIMLHQVKMTF